MEKAIKQLVLWNWRMVGLMVAVGGGTLAMFGRNLPPEVPLLYSRPWGQEQLVAPVWLWGLPIVGAGVGMGLAWLGERSGDKILGIMILATALVVQMVLILGLMRIVMLVI